MKAGERLVLPLPSWWTQLTNQPANQHRDKHHQSCFFSFFLSHAVLGARHLLQAGHVSIQLAHSGNPDTEKIRVFPPCDLSNLNPEGETWRLERKTDRVSISKTMSWELPPAEKRYTQIQTRCYSLFNMKIISIDPVRDLLKPTHILL